jgi:hypothetical protein
MRYSRNLTVICYGCQDEEGENEEGDYDEEGEYEEGDEGEEGEEGDEEVDEEVLAEMEAAHQADKKQLKKGSNGESTAAVAEAPASAVAAGEAVKEVLPIAEDPVAHVFLKHLFQFEAAVEVKLGFVAGKAKKLLADASFTKLVSHTSDKKATVVDDSLWVDAYVAAGAEEQGPCSVARRLLELLGENDDTFAAWLGQNRPCFALVKLFAVPSVLSEVTTVLNKQRLAVVKAASEKHEGGKLLLQLYELVKKAK